MVSSVEENISIDALKGCVLEISTSFRIRVSVLLEMEAKHKKSYFIGWKNGEPGGIRTHDPMIKSHVLYRLSYGLHLRGCVGARSWPVNRPSTGRFAPLTG